MKKFKIGYPFESSTHHIKPFESKSLSFEISLNEDFSNTLSFTGKGYDIEDIFNFNSYIFDSVLDCLSIYYGVPFDTRHQFSDRYTSRISSALLISPDPENYVRYKEIELDQFMISIIENIVTLEKENYDKRKIFKMTRLFRDGLRIEYYGLNNLSINFKEIAQSLYMSCLEVMSESPKENKKCEKCGQENYKIAQRVSDLIDTINESEELSKFFKKEYGKRSDFLHTGAYFSSNNFVAPKNIPQLSVDSEHGHILQVNHFASLDVIKKVLRAIFIKEF